MTITIESLDRICSSRVRRILVASVLTASSCLLLTRGVEAQIKQPGAHAKYTVELEPHAAIWWEDNHHTSWDNNSGWGLGMRASIPIVENGFVPSINNNVAIGFGLDWGRWSHTCWWYGDRHNPSYSGDCSANTLWFPVVMQWNFFITKAFSVFGEPGLAIRHSWWRWEDGYCGGPANNPTRCNWSDSSTDLEPVFFVGGRVGNDKVSFTFRLGWPYASVGASFFL